MRVYFLLNRWHPSGSAGTDNFCHRCGFQRQKWGEQIMNSTRNVFMWSPLAPFRFGNRICFEDPVSVYDIFI